VTQSNEPYENDGSDEVLITVNARGSSGDILRAVTLGAITNPEDSSIEANVYLDMFDFDRERAFRKGCLDISVHVVLPANMTHFESLKVHHRSKGNVYVDMSRFDRNGRNDNYGYYPEPPAPTVPHLLFDRLDIKVDDGYVSVVGTGATEELKVVSAQGRLFGHVFANKRVEVESKQHTTLTVISTSSDLDLKASAETVAATVVRNYMQDTNRVKIHSLRYPLPPPLSLISENHMVECSTHSPLCIFCVLEISILWTCGDDDLDTRDATPLEFSR
jgi:hypothetical protein